jgi:hypothetical protein
MLAAALFTEEFVAAGVMRAVLDALKGPGDI